MEIVWKLQTYRFCSVLFRVTGFKILKNRKKHESVISSEVTPGTEQTLIMLLKLLKLETHGSKIVISPLLKVK